MATLQSLKKKLKAIKSTEKLTKAMKTVSAAKFSKLNRGFGEYSAYRDACFSLLEKFQNDINSVLSNLEVNEDAPAGVFVFTSNKGMCGSFNTEILALAQNTINELPDNTLIFPCGKKAVAYFSERKNSYKEAFLFSDTPTVEECDSFLAKILELRNSGVISSVHLVYPQYKNIINQNPTHIVLFSNDKQAEKNEDDDNTLYIPDKKSVIDSLAKKIVWATVYSVVIETALGAQAATLTTMRSAYDTASAFSQMLETQIHRKRQSEVTADVLETATERE